MTLRSIAEVYVITQMHPAPLEKKNTQKQPHQLWSRFSTNLSISRQECLIRVDGPFPCFSRHDRTSHRMNNKMERKITIEPTMFMKPLPPPPNLRKPP